MNNNCWIIGKGFIGNELFSFLKNNNVGVLHLTRTEFYQKVELNTSFSGYIINCAGVGHPSFLDNNFNLIDEEIRLANSISNFVKKNNACLIHCSSAAACGLDSNDFSEERNNSLNNTPYGKLKSDVENIYLDNCSELLILRIFSIYGIGLKKQLFYDIFNKYQNVNLNFKLNSIKDQRSFVNIFDFCSAVFYLISNFKFNRKFINISSELPITILESINISFDILNNLYGNNLSPIISFEKNIDSANLFESMHPTSSSLHKLGFKSKVNFNSGLEEYFKWLINE